jgi:hypothetical protein
MIGSCWHRVFVRTRLGQLALARWRSQRIQQVEAGLAGKLQAE